MKAYKHLFEFIYETLGYSPGGGQDGLTCLIKKNNISQEDFNFLKSEWRRYHAEYDGDENKRLPEFKFQLTV